MSALLFYFCAIIDHFINHSNFNQQLAGFYLETQRQKDPGFLEQNHFILELGCQKAGGCYSQPLGHVDKISKLGGWNLWETFLLIYFIPFQSRRIFVFIFSTQDKGAFNPESTEACFSFVFEVWAGNSC